MGGGSWESPAQGKTLAYLPIYLGNQDNVPDAAGRSVISLENESLSCKVDGCDRHRFCPGVGPIRTR